MVGRLDEGIAGAMAPLPAERGPFFLFVYQAHVPRHALFFREFVPIRSWEVLTAYWYRKSRRYFFGLSELHI